MSIDFHALVLLTMMLHFRDDIKDVPIFEHK